MSRMRGEVSRENVWKARTVDESFGRQKQSTRNYLPRKQTDGKIIYFLFFHSSIFIPFLSNLLYVFTCVGDYKQAEDRHFSDG